MVDIKKIRITKKAYKFEIRKKYYNIRRYKIKQKKPLEKIKEAIDKLLSQKEKKVEQQQIPKQKPGLNFIVIVAAIIVAIIVIIGALFYLKITSIPVEPATSVSSKAYLNFSILDHNVATIGDIRSNAHVAYVTTFFSYDGIKNATVTLYLYKEEVQSQIFLLESQREAAETKIYQQFINALSERLKKKGLLLNEIDFEQLESLPKGAIVLVPTGTVPQELLGADSKIKIKKLMERGVVIIYIGKAFTKGMITSSGTIVQTPQSVLAATDFSFNENVILEVKDGFHVSQPLYTVTGRGGENRLQHGFISIIKYGDGAFVFIPQTLDAAWENNANLAADDVERILTEMPWTTLVNEPRTYFFNGTSNFSGRIDFFSNAFTTTEPKSAKVEIVAYTTEGKKEERIEITKIKRKYPGDLYIDGGSLVAPTDITGKKIRMNAAPRGNESGERFLFLRFTKGGEEVGEREPIEGARNIQTETTIQADIHLDSGEYVVHLIDDENNEYAQCYMMVVSVDIVYLGKDGSKYSFSIKKEGEEQPVKISKIDVEIENGKYGSESFSDVSNITIDVGKATGGQDLQPRAAPYIFTFKIGKLTKEIPISVPRKSTLIDEPLFQASIVLGLIIVAIGIYFAKREDVIYLIDIPDFPPVERTKIVMKPEDVIGIFDRVNEDYKWRFMPLTLTEIKNGFRKIFHEGKPIYISEYNAEFILNDLIRSGDVKRYLDYYGLTKWENESGFSVKYLALMRRIRDICINNAVPFTLLGESKDSDCEITCAGQQMYIHIYESNDKEKLKKLAQRALKTIKESITIILFINGDEKRDFEMFLSSPSQAFLILKLEHEANSLLLLTTEEFEKLIKELKEV
jgi:hypothetical protein